MQVGVDRCFASREEPPGNVNNGDVHSKGRRYAWKGTNRIMNNGWADNIWILKNIAGVGGGEKQQKKRKRNTKTKKRASKIPRQEYWDHLTARDRQ
jgi:hypothetical protein